ncbi:MAG: ABC transporter permease [Bacteroidales bacterium]|nr:ABC transporter permease [Bacteroidales bacterium]
MWRNYLKIAFRNLNRDRGYTLINVAGLAVGLTVFMLIMMFVVHELSYDRFHEKHEQIYRLAHRGQFAGQTFEVAVSSGTLPEFLYHEFPEVEDFVRIEDTRRGSFFSVGDKEYYEDDFIYVDTSFTNVFSFKFLQGNPREALTEPYSLVLSEDIAQKYFPGQNPVGKVVRFKDEENFKVTGVIENCPSNSHFNYSMIASFSTLMAENNASYEGNLTSLQYHTYLLLNENAGVEKLNSQLEEFLKSKLLQDEGLELDLNSLKIIPFLQNITDIHLHSNLGNEIASTGNYSHVLIFLAIAIFILLIACINFMNLASAKSQKRAREVGMRKVHGAVKSQLIFQFLGEAVIVSLFALIIALALSEIFLPEFTNLIGLGTDFHIYQRPLFLLSMTGIAVLTGLISGSYPAFYLSSFQPTRVLKGKFHNSRGRSVFRNALVLFQFAISIFLIIGAIVVYQQLNYVKNKDLGFNKEQMLVVPLRGKGVKDKAQVLKNEMATLKGVKSIALSSRLPGGGLDGMGFIPEGVPRSNPWIFYEIDGGHDYIETMGMEVLQGRGFDKRFSTDTTAVIINETARKKLGWEKPVGKNIIQWRHTPNGVYEINTHVVGVVKDFNFKSLHNKVEPLIIVCYPQHPNYLNIRLDEGNHQQTITSIEKTWNSIEKKFPFDYSFLNETYDRLYQADMRMGKLFIYFTVIAIMIACLGLLGLASYVTEQRTQEVGIRKVLGATVKQISMLLSMQFTRTILLANILAWPVAYLILDNWLSNFEYSISIHVWAFLTAAAITYVIAIFTIGYQTIRAANTNPVETLKYE